MSVTPDNCRYTETHEWLKQEDNLVVVGITEHAQKLLGELVFVELPELDSCERGAEIAVVESVKAASDVYCPLNGEIVAVNEALNDSPNLVNTDPYGEGWLFKMKLADNNDLDNCLDAASYAEQISD